MLPSEFQDPLGYLNWLSPLYKMTQYLHTPYCILLCTLNLSNLGISRLLIFLIQCKYYGESYCMILFRKN